MASDDSCAASRNAESGAPGSYDHGNRWTDGSPRQGQNRYPHAPDLQARWRLQFTSRRSEKILSGRGVDCEGPDGILIGRDYHTRSSINLVLRIARSMEHKEADMEATISNLLTSY